MKDQELFLLYTYYNPTDFKTERSSGNQYYIQKCFSNKQIIDKEVLTEVYKDMLLDTSPVEEEELVGPFADKNELNRFCQELVQKLKGERIYLFSPNEFNMIIEKSPNLKNIEENMLASKDIIENEKKKERSSFINRFFN